MSSLSPYTDEYWEVVKDRDRWKAEALAARELIVVGMKPTGDTEALAAWIPFGVLKSEIEAYAAARAANEGREQ